MKMEIRNSSVQRWREYCSFCCCCCFGYIREMWPHDALCCCVEACWSLHRVSRHLAAGAVYELNNETWVWKKSINAVSLTHIPRSPPTDWLSLLLPPPSLFSSSLPHFPAAVPAFCLIWFYFSLLASFSPVYSFHIFSLSPWHLFSLVFFSIPPPILLLLHILIFSGCCSFLCPLLYVPVTASWYKMADTLSLSFLSTALISIWKAKCCWKIKLCPIPPCSPHVLLLLCDFISSWWAVSRAGRVGELFFLVWLL